MRLDLFIFNKYNLKSRTYAAELIKKGQVKVNGEVVYKSSIDVDDKSDISIDNEDNFASQGAYKLKKAIEEFKIDVKGKVCADFGCSNGGFTDVLLRNGADFVYAYDVGDCALDPKLLETNKVDFSKCNLRYLDEISKVDFVCCDVSFISVKLIIPAIFKILKTNGEGVILIKPQFEAGRSYLNKNGIVTDKSMHEKVVNDVISCLKDYKLEPINKTISPIYYEDKNIEYLVYFKKN